MADQEAGVLTPNPPLVQAPDPQVPQVPQAP